MTEYNTILVEQRGAVTLVTLNRPQALNALNSDVLRELIQVFAAMSDTWPAQAQRDRWQLGMGGRPDSCWMWRRGGALEQARTPEDPRFT